MTDVEEKTFEYGMIRSLGLHHSILIIILFFQVHNIININIYIYIIKN